MLDMPMHRFKAYLGQTKYLRGLRLSDKVTASAFPKSTDSGRAEVRSFIDRCLDVRTSEERAEAGWRHLRSVFGKKKKKD